jgi:2-oxoglutarate dehydrogenase E2 component (dihydrolipoamide succinyltransferase)
MFEITIPKLNNNDTSYILVEWVIGDGEEVAPDAPIAVVETSKAAEELVAEKGGVLHHVVGLNAEVELGAVIGRVFDTEQERQEYLAAGRHTQETDEPVGEVVVTKSARDAAGELGIDLAELRGLGKKVLKRRDVEEFAAARSAEAPAEPAPGEQAGTERVTLSRAQRAVGEVVARSHQTIPAAFAVIKVPVDAALRWCADVATRSDGAPGLPELLVKAIAGLRERYPLFFGHYEADGTVSLTGGAHVGVTLDLGKGLYIPVVRDAGNRPLTEVTDALMDFRISALRGTFQESELTGGNITISLSNDDGIVLARPIIFSGQTCMVCLCATQEEVYRTSEGDVDVRRFVNLGLTYDHRVVNGRDATAFLGELRAVLADEAACARLAEEPVAGP